MRRVVPDVSRLPERPRAPRASSPARPARRGVEQPAIDAPSTCVGAGLGKHQRPAARPREQDRRRPLASGPVPRHRSRSRHHRPPAHREPRHVTLAAQPSADPYIVALPNPTSPVITAAYLVAAHAHLNPGYAYPVRSRSLIREHPSAPRTGLHWNNYPQGFQAELRLVAWKMLN